MGFIVDPNNFSIFVWANSQTSGQELKYFIIFFSTEKSCDGINAKPSTKPGLKFEYGAGLYPKKRS